MNDETFHKFRSIIVFRAFHSIISHRVVSIKQRFERISKTARATLIYIGFCRSFENMIRNLLEYFVIYRRMRTFEFREIDEPLCVSRSRIIDRVEARTEKIASQKFRSRGGKEKAITLLDSGTMAHQRICRKIIPLFRIECKPDCT